MSWEMQPRLREKGRNGRHPDQKRRGKKKKNEEFQKKRVQRPDKKMGRLGKFAIFFLPRKPFPFFFVTDCSRFSFFFLVSFFLLSLFLFPLSFPSFLSLFLPLLLFPSSFAYSIDLIVSLNEASPHSFLSESHTISLNTSSAR